MDSQPPSESGAFRKATQRPVTRLARVATLWLALGTSHAHAQETTGTVKPRATSISTTALKASSVTISAKPGDGAQVSGTTRAPAPAPADKQVLGQAVTVAPPAAAYVVRQQDNVKVDLASESVDLKKGELLVVRSKAKRLPSMPTSPPSDAPVATVAPGVAPGRPDDAPPGAPGLEQTQSLSTAGEALVPLPYEARFIDEGGELKTSEVVAQVVGGGLRMLASPRRFVGTLYVKLQDQREHGAAYDLPAAVELLINGALDTVSPTLLSIVNTNRWYPVQLEAETPHEPVTLSVTTPTDSAGLMLTIPVIRPRLSVDVVPPRVQGFGLEAAEVVVQVEGLPAPEGYAVLLKTDAGQLSTTRLSLDAQGTALAQLRSRSTGPVRVQVSAASLLPATSPPEVSFEWPWRFLIFASLGAGLGATISAINHRKSRTRRWLTWEVLASIALGVLVAVGAAVGVNLLSIELPSGGGEALFFLVAALGGLGSLALPKWMSASTTAIKTG